MKLKNLRGKHKQIARDYLATTMDKRPRGSLYVGSVRAGKTVVQSVVGLSVAAEFPVDKNVAIFSATRETAARNLVEPYFHPLMGSMLTERQHYLNFWGRKVWIIGCDNIRAMDKIKGMTIGLALLDEVTTFPKQVFGMIMTRLSEENAAWIGTTNTDSPYHWLYTDVIEPGDICDVITFLIEENEHLSKDYIRDVKREMLALGQVYYDRYILAKWVAAEGQIFKVTAANYMGPAEYTLFNMVKPAPELVIGVDYGTANPTAAVALFCTKDQLVVGNEFYYNPDNDGGTLTDFQLAKKITEWADDNGYPSHAAWFVDPSALAFKEQLRLMGRLVYDQKDLRDVSRGIASVSSLLGLGRLKIYKSTTPNLQKEMTNYVWASPPKNSKEGYVHTEQPRKRNDHACDALRYAVYSRVAKRYWKWWLTDVSKAVLNA